MTRARLPLILVGLGAALLGCGSNIKSTSFQAFQVQLNGPVPTYVGPALDPFLNTEKYRVTVSYFEDKDGKIPYFEGRKKPPLFANFQPVQVTEIPAGQERIPLTATGNDASLPRISSSQTSVFVKAEIVGLTKNSDGVDIPIARARCLLQELQVLTAGTEPRVLCQAFYGFIGKWNEVRPPAVSRVDFAAIATSDGRVFIAGGRVNDDDVSDQTDVGSMEVYQPTIPDPHAPAASPGSWLMVPNAVQPARSGLSAVLTPKTGLLFFVGGWAAGVPSNGYDIFDTAEIPKVKKHSQLGNSQAEMGAALWDAGGTRDTILVGGGVTSADAVPTSTTVVVDSAQQIAPGPTLSSSRRSPCFAGLANQKVLACGGATDANPDSSCELLTSESLTGTTSGEMVAPRADVKCVVTGPAGSESVFLVGGNMAGQSDEDGQRIEKWRGGTITALEGVAPGPLTRHAVTLSEGLIYVTGGYRPGTTEPRAGAFTINVADGAVTEVASMLNPRAGHQIVSLPDGTVMAIGGLSGRPLARFGAEIFVPE